MNRLIIYVICLISVSCTSFSGRRSPSSSRDYRKSCSGIFERFLRSNRFDFDLVVYQKTREEIKKGEFKAFREELSKEEKLALLHQGAFSKDSKIEEILSLPSNHSKRKRLLLSLNKTKMSEYDLNSFFFQIHKLRFKEKSLLKGEIYTNQEVVNAYLYRSVKVIGLKKTLKELGLFKDPTRWENFKYFVKRSEISEWTSLLLFNLHVFMTSIPVPAYLPPSYSYKLNETEVLKLLEANGEDEVLKLLEKKYSNKIIFHHHKERIKKFYPLILLSAVATYFAFNQEELESILMDFKKQISPSLNDIFLSPILDSLSSLELIGKALSSPCYDYNLALKFYEEAYGKSIESDPEVHQIFINEYGVDPKECKNSM